MTGEELLGLLSQQEGPTLEFKRNVPDLDNVFQCDKMVRDILALVNGNGNVVGEPAYLIWGAANTVNVLGQRARYDVGSDVDAPTIRDRIVHIMRSACHPPINNLQYEVVEVGHERLVVLTIPPSPYVHETTRELTLKAKDKNRKKRYTKVYTKHTVFMRVGAAVDIAACADRDALRERKQRQFNESNNVSSVLFGAATGGLVGGVFGTKDDKALMLTRLFNGIAGSGVGALFGYAYTALRPRWRDLEQIAWIPPAWRGPAFVGVLAMSGSMTYGIRQLLSKVYTLVRRREA